MDERLSLLITEWLLFIIRSPLALRQRRTFKLFSGLSAERNDTHRFFSRTALIALFDISS